MAEDGTTSFLASFFVAARTEFQIFKITLFTWISLMVSGLDSGSGDLVLRPGQVLTLCFWARRSTFTVPLSNLGYNKWGTRKFSGKPDEMALFAYRIY